MRLVYFITHPDVIIDPHVPVPQWPLSPRGRERMQRLLDQSWIALIGSIYSSTEQKAVDGAEILAAHRALLYHGIKALGEIDRSATGYLPHEEHMATAELFFADPYTSIRGWERAIDAQQRITGAINDLIVHNSQDGHIAIVSHGAVGMLHLCELQNRPINQRDIPPGTHGGCYYCFEAQSKRLVHSWKLIDAQAEITAEAT